MKQIFTVMLAVMAMAAMAAETAIELKKKSDVTGYGNSKYYLAKPVVSVADGVAKVVCGKTAEGVRPINYQFAVRSAMKYTAGMTYTITFVPFKDMSYFCPSNGHMQARRSFCLQNTSGQPSL